MTDLEPLGPVIVFPFVHMRGEGEAERGSDLLVVQVCPHRSVKVAA
jgi:hypothetical protein